MDNERKLENLPTSEIIELAYSEQDEEEYWHYIGALHGRGTIREFEAAAALCKSPDPVRREIGADILGQLGWSAHAFQTESVAILIGLLTDDEDDVIASAAFSLGHRNDPAAISELCRLIHHPNERVRLGVTTGLSRHEDSQAIQGLITLSNDDSDDVRNWATFGLGSQIDMDSPEIRDALTARLPEENLEIRGEALVGLARRGDETVVNYIMKELASDEIKVLVLEAAEALADPALYPLLLKWKSLEDGNEDQYFENQLKRTLEACSQSRG